MKWFEGTIITDRNFKRVSTFKKIRILFWIGLKPYLLSFLSGALALSMTHNVNTALIIFFIVLTSPWSQK